MILISGRIWAHSYMYSSYLEGGDLVEGGILETIITHIDDDVEIYRQAKDGLDLLIR